MHPFLWSLSIFCWQDIAEIIILFGAFLYVSLWFQQDSHKPLLQWLYGYTGVFLITYYFHMITITTILITCAPITFVILFLIHKNTLQKNFIALHAQRHTTESTNLWPDLLMQVILHQAHNNREILCVIEKNNALNACLDLKELPLNAPLSRELLTFITSSPLYKPEKLLVISKNGIITTCNGVWKKNSIEHWFTQEVTEQDEWIQDALFFTTKTDALVFKYILATHTYTLIQNGIITYNVSTPSLIHHLYQHTSIIFTAKKDQGAFYGTHTWQQQKHSEQTLP